MMSEEWWAMQKVREAARVAAVLEYIRDNHQNPSCRLEEVAQMLGLSRSYLSRAILRGSGAPFNRHLRLARMKSP